VVIKNGLHWVWERGFACRDNPLTRIDREPHIGFFYCPC